MFGYFKVSLNFLLSFLMALPAYSGEQSNATGIVQANPAHSGSIKNPNVQVSENKKSVAQENLKKSNENRIKDFIGIWNTAGNVNNLLKVLTPTSKEAALLGKLRAILKLKSQKLPKAYFDEKNLLVTINKENMQIQSFEPLSFSINGKALQFTQAKTEERIDYLIKEFLNMANKKSVFFEILLPAAFAKSEEGSNMKWFWWMAGIIAGIALLGWAFSASASADDGDDGKDSRSVQDSNFSDAVRDYDSSIAGISCDKKTKKLNMLSVDRNKISYQYVFDPSNIGSNEIKQLFVNSGQQVCHFVVEGAEWRRANNNVPTICKPPTDTPHIPPDFVPIEEARSCCRDSKSICESKINAGSYIRADHTPAASSGAVSPINSNQ
jgi:hypothetical protein